MELTRYCIVFDFHFIIFFSIPPLSDEQTPGQLFCESSPSLKCTVSAMATTDEVTVSMGEVVMVKAEGEGDPSDPNKTQVILQLQPITSGYVTKQGVTRCQIFNATHTATGMPNGQPLLGLNSGLSSWIKSTTLN